MKKISREIRSILTKRSGVRLPEEIWMIIGKIYSSNKKKDDKNINTFLNYFKNGDKHLIPVIGQLIQFNGVVIFDNISIVMRITDKIYIKIIKNLRENISTISDITVNHRVDSDVQLLEILEYIKNKYSLNCNYYKNYYNINCDYSNYSIINY